MPKIKGVDISSLNKRQQTAMKNHSKHHTAKHIRSMIASIKKGSNFTESHKIAMEKVGK
jgi:hypothetical protein